MKRPRRERTKPKYFRVTHGKVAGVPVDISRTGYTGDLGFGSLDAVARRQ